jgi:hypothetical protein
MASTYSTSLKLELIGTGDQSGSWGNTTNNNLGTLLEQAIVGQYTVVMTNADFTLTDIDGTSDQARNAAIIITGNQSGTYTVICPAVQKLYMITNNLNSGATAYFKPSGGAPISIANGNTILVYCTGSTIVPLNYADKANSVANLTGGSAARIPYQTATDTTGFIATPTAGTFLRWNGSAYDWSSSTGSASTITGGAANQLLYQVGAGSTSFVTAPTSANSVLNWTGTAFNWVSNAGGTTNQALTFNNSGTGGGSSQTFNGSTAITISYNTIGASPLAGSAFLTTTGTVTSGEWRGTLGAISGASLTNLTAANIVGTVSSANTANTATTATTATTASGLTGSPNITVTDITGNRVVLGGFTPGGFNLAVKGTYAGQSAAFLETYSGASTALGINCVGGAIYGTIFQYNGTNVGGITLNSTSTTYNTSSDRRIKSNISDLTGSGTIIDALKPRIFTWNESGEKAKGFIADELQQVVPAAVTGEPNDVNEDGTPKYQMVDASTPEMMALIICELQSLRKRVAQLEAK